MGSSDSTNRGEPRAPREAAPIPLDQLDLDQRAALFSMQRAFANILTDVGPLVEVKVEPARCRLPGARPERDRASRLMLINGGRGSGKSSLLLTLLDAWAGVRGAERAVPEHHTLKQDILDAEPLDDQRGRWFDQGLAKRVWALPILDFDPMPKGLPLVAWVLQALRAVVEALGDDPCAARTLGERGRSEQRGLSLRETWHRLHDDAVLAWEDSSDGTGFQARAEQDRQRLRSWSGFEDRFASAMDALFNAIKQQAGRLDAHFDLLVLPIDDVDMQVSRSPELLHALRLLRHKRLVFLCTGDKALLEQTAQAKADGELARLASGGPLKKGPVDELGAKVVQKMFHPAHTWHRHTFGLRDVLRNLVKVEENKAYRWAKWAAELEYIVGEVVSPATVRLWRMNYRDLTELAAELSRHEPKPVSEEPSAARTFQAIQEVDHLFAQLLGYLPDNNDRARALINEPSELREELMESTFGSERVVDQTATIEHAVHDPDGGAALQLGLDFRRRLPVLKEADRPVGELLLAWSQLIRLAGPGVLFLRSPPLVEVGMGKNTPPPVRGLSRVPGVPGDTWVYWPISAELRAYLRTEARLSLLNDVLSMQFEGPRTRATPPQSLAALDSYHLTCVWLLAHFASGSEFGEAMLEAAAKERELPEDARRFEDLIGRAEPVRHIARALVHPMFGLGRAVRTQLMVASFGTSRGVSELSHLRDDMQPSGPVTKLIRDAATLSGADAEGDLARLEVAPQGAEPWWRLKMLAHWGPGAWAAHLFGRAASLDHTRSISPYMISGEGEWHISSHLRGDGQHFVRQPHTSQHIFSPGPELGMLGFQAMKTQLAHEWDQLLWSPAQTWSCAQWIAQAWELTCRTEGRPYWRGRVTATSDGQSLDYSGPKVQLSLDDPTSDGLHFHWTAETADGDPRGSIPGGSALPGLLGLVMDLTRGDFATTNARKIHLATNLMKSDGDLIAAVGTPPVRSFIAAERLRAWRPYIRSGWEHRDDWRQQEEALLIAGTRWVRFCIVTNIRDDANLMCNPPALESTPGQQISSIASHIAVVTNALNPAIELSSWLRSVLPLFEAVGSTAVLRPWRDAINQQPKLPVVKNAPTPAPR